MHDDTRRLRRMLAKDRAKILFATVSQHAGHWWVALNIEAADLHPAHQHGRRSPDDQGGWVGIDRGLSASLVAATTDGTELVRVHDAPKALRAGMRRQRHLAKMVSRRKKGSQNRRQTAARLGRHHHRVANVRRHFLHRVSNELVKTHDRLAIENLHVSGMLRTTIWPKQSPTRGGPSSPAYWVTSSYGAAANSRSLTAGTRRASSAQHAESSTPTSRSLIGCSRARAVD